MNGIRDRIDRLKTDFGSGWELENPVNNFNYYLSQLFTSPDAQKDPLVLVNRDKGLRRFVSLNSEVDKILNAMHRSLNAQLAKLQLPLPTASVNGLTMPLLPWWKWTDQLKPDDPKTQFDIKFYLWTIRDLWPEVTWSIHGNFHRIDDIKIIRIDVEGIKFGPEGLPWLNRRQYLSEAEEKIRDFLCSFSDQ